MTDKQRKAIEKLRTAIIKHDGNGDGYEYKRFEVRELNWGLSNRTVQVKSEVGLVDDEGTMAGVLCRTRRHIFVGSRGGLTLVNTARFIKDGAGLRKIPAANAKGWRATWALTI